jgi:FdhD protein
VNSEFYAALMCTPLEAKELAVGFLFSEGVISSMDSIKSVDHLFENRICVLLNHEILVDPSSVRAITSGCGKGSVHVISLEEGSLKPIESNCSFEAINILKLMKEFNSKSDLFKQTGGVHSCCICSDQSLLLFSEDIGRHNALDKVVGKAGIQIIVSHSAPTSLALSIAKAANITIIGFARGSRMNVYCNKQRVF